MLRLLLALAFGAVLWLDPSQPYRHPVMGYLLLAGYIGVAAALLAVAYLSWWWDTRLALPFYLVDVLLFLAALYFTEYNESNFISPYVGFFIFLILQAVIRLDWRPALGGLPVLALLYVADALALKALGIDTDMQRIMRCAAYMVVIAAVFIWFAANRGEPRIGRFAWSTPASAPLNGVMAAAAAYAAGELRAARVFIVWNDPDEPWTEMMEWREGATRAQRLEPQPDDPLTMSPFGEHPTLFSVANDRALCFGLRDHPTLKRGAVHCPIAGLAGIDGGLTFPLRSTQMEGRVLLTDIGGVCADDVQMAEILRREIESALDRHSVAEMQAREAGNRLREAIARDLHDTVAQSLAGAAYRLESVRSAVQEGRNATTELNEVKDALRAEQQNVRHLIDELKAESTSQGLMELRTYLEQSLPTLAAGWGVQLELESGVDPICIGARTAHQVRQLLREAVANAVRHGHAERVKIACMRVAETLELTIRDDGRGFPEASDLRPRSILERIRLLDGELAVQSSAAGARLRIRLPAEAD